MIRGTMPKILTSGVKDFKIMTIALEKRQKKELWTSCGKKAMMMKIALYSRMKAIAHLMTITRFHQNLSKTNPKKLMIINKSKTLESSKLEILTNLM